MQTHFTATTHILCHDRALLLWHPKLQKWLPPGGHVEEGETPDQTAMREVQEEVGLKIEFYRQENFWVGGDAADTKSFLRPYYCLQEFVPATKKEEAHRHLDLIYVARPQLHVPEAAQEKIPYRFWSLQEVETCTPGQDIFLDTQEALRHLLTCPALLAFSRIALQTVLPLQKLFYEKMQREILHTTGFGAGA